MKLRITKDDLTPGLQSKLRTISDHRPILEAMGLQLQSLTVRAFGDPRLRVNPWKPKKDGTPSNLVKTTALRQSIQRPPVITAKAATVGSDRKYAAIHQFGGKTRPMPARPFFPFINRKLSPQAEMKIAKVAGLSLRIGRWPHPHP